jgi:hypothetical protein
MIKKVIPIVFLGLLLVSGIKVGAQGLCGGYNGVCCEQGNPAGEMTYVCDIGFVCDTTGSTYWCKPEHTVDCGVEGKPCCPSRNIRDTCGAGNFCMGGTCRSNDEDKGCDETGKSCCPDPNNNNHMTCSGGLVCDLHSSTCCYHGSFGCNTLSCQEVGDPCCTNNTCGGNLECKNGFCKKISTPVIGMLPRYRRRRLLSRFWCVLCRRQVSR